MYFFLLFFLKLVGETYFVTVKRASKIPFVLRATISANTLTMVDLSSSFCKKDPAVTPVFFSFL